ncbi:gamma-interferon-inducible lysosomal thiol reductase-like [Lytechinus pictus]|uniref:gamma-interferon-inducible lysosomal thiol reductase-like n=1 Tax=Lytechinus pictus TaxID=7653 RepID=UPI0030B9D446
MLFRNCISILLIFGTPLLVLGCGFSPDLWCSSPEISEKCGVEKQCSLWHSKQALTDVPLVHYELYYESLCPGCKQLILTQLYPAWLKVQSIVNVTLVPYGNAQEREYGSKWYFTCQHGPAECVGNLVETCILSILPFDKAFPFIHCLEMYNPSTDGKYCASMFNLSSEWPSIEECSTGPMGNYLEHNMAVKTNALNPPHQYVPWVVLNGVHNEEIQNKAASDSLALICNAYQGVKPAGCTKTCFKRSPVKRIL